MEIIQYPHPTLRRPSKPIRRVDAELRSNVAEMFELMYEAKGVGLAANQVDLPYRAFVCNPRRSEEEEDREFVFINPVVTARKGNEEAEEGCLSVPELYAPVRRPATIAVEAYSLEGEKFSLQLDGLFARVVQHEIDHLDGVLFIDRLSETARIDVQDELHELESKFSRAREEGRVPSDAEIVARLTEIEKKYC